MPFQAKFPKNYLVQVYHCVSNDYLLHLKNVINYKNEKDFEKDLDYLSKKFQFLDWDFFKKNYKKTFAKPIALLTFDDGLMEFKEIVLPILIRKGIYAINFINPAFVDSNKIMFRFKASIIVDEIKWLTKKPWVLNGENKNLNYQFSAYDKIFEFLFIKTFENNELTGVLFLSVRNKTLKLLKIFGNDYEAFAENIYRYILKNKINNFICFDENINTILRKKYSLFTKERFRKFIMEKALKQKLSEDFHFKATALDADADFT